MVQEKINKFGLNPKTIYSWAIFFFQIKIISWYAWLLCSNKLGVRCETNSLFEHQKFKRLLKCIIKILKLPNKQYLGILVPTIPAITAPVWIPKK